MRAPLAVAVAAVLAVPATAHASGLPARCSLVHDVAGDDRSVLPAGSELDLLELRAQLQGDALVVQVRVPPEGGAIPTSGEEWAVRMTVGSSLFSLVATRAVDGEAFAAYGGPADASQPWLGNVSGQVDLARGVVTVRAPLRRLGLRRSSTFSRLQMQTLQGEATSGEPLVGTPVAGPPQATATEVDEASTDVTRALTRLCG